MDSGWRGANQDTYTKCLEYLCFTHVEIVGLIRHLSLGLAECRGISKGCRARALYRCQLDYLYRTLSIDIAGVVSASVEEYRYNLIASGWSIDLEVMCCW